MEKCFSSIIFHDHVVRSVFLSMSRAFIYFSVQEIAFLKTCFSPFLQRNIEPGQVKFEGT